MRLALPLLLTAPVFAQAPYEDTGFADSTPATDVDLIVVRERAHGATGVDLSPYDPALGVEDYVQSIYLRAYHATSLQKRAIRGRLLFPPQVTVLTVISDEADLGGSTDDGLLTASDADFAIGSDPDLYSAQNRGTEGYLGSEHSCARTNNTVDFHMFPNGNDLDDFRVIIDYGTSFPADLAFDVQLIDDTAAIHLVTETGIHVGETPSTTFGNGVWPAAFGVVGVPLTSLLAPSQGTALVFDALECVTIQRNGAVGEVLDFWDPVNQVLVANAREGALHALGAGPYGRIYGRLVNFAGITVIDLIAGSIGKIPITGLPVASYPPERVTGVPGTNEVLCGARGSVNGPYHYYTVDVRTGVVTNFWETAAGTTQSAIAGIKVVGNELFVACSERHFLALDMATGNYTSTQFGGSGAFMDMMVAPSGTELWILRRSQVTRRANVDVYDIATGTLSPGLVDDPDGAWCSSLTLDDQGELWVLTTGQNIGIGHFAVYDPSTWTLIRVEPCAAPRGGTNTIIDLVPARIDDQYCTQTAKHSQEGLTWVTAYGSLAVADNDFQLTAYNVRGGQFGYFLNGLGAGFVPHPSSSLGNLCLDPSQGLGRFNSQVQNAGTHGVIAIQVDLANLPRPTGPVAVLPGDTWYFQCWYRDGVGVSNFSDAISVTFN